MTRTTIRSEDIDSTLDLSSKTVTLPAASVTTHVTQTDTTPLEDDIAILGFKVAANGSLSKYNLADQTIDSYEDATGVDTSGSTNEQRDASNYYSGWSAGSPTTISFTTVETTTWTVPTGVTEVEYLVLGGGGGASGGTASVNLGSSGAGGIHKTASGFAVVPAASLTVTVGAGGAGSLGTGSNGGSSVFSTITSTGGNGVGTGRTGGSNASYSGGTGSFEYDGGGGAGAGGNGSSRNGGVGVTSSITGSAIGRGGGGGAPENGTSSDGGAVSNPLGSSAAANTGGGGAGGSTVTSGGSGGSGIVILKYTPLNEADLTLISNATTAQATPTKGDLVMTYSNGAGTATINTDLKAYASRDNGTTWTQLTLASQGSTGAHTILSAHDLDISGQPSGTDMKYKITTHNQSVTKSTRIHAVSLGWS